MMRQVAHFARRYGATAKRAAVGSRARNITYSRAPAAQWRNRGVLTTSLRARPFSATSRKSIAVGNHDEGADTADTPASIAVEVTDMASFVTEVAQSPVPVLFDAYANWRERLASVLEDTRRPDGDAPTAAREMQGRRRQRHHAVAGRGGDAARFPRPPPGLLDAAAAVGARAAQKTAIGRRRRPRRRRPRRRAPRRSPAAAARASSCAPASAACRAPRRRWPPSWGPPT